MGAEGGIVGLKMKPQGAKDVAYIRLRLRDILPDSFLYWDSYRHDDAMEKAVKELQGDHILSTYGSFQSWSLMDLPAAVEEAKAYSQAHPEATFGDMLEELLTHPTPGHYEWMEFRDGTMSRFLLDMYRGAHLQNPDSFLQSKISDWTEEVESLVELPDYPTCVETWT